MKSVVILPTFNERENLAGITRAILEQKIPGLSILIVDDNSPDGTGALADTLAQRYQEIAVLHRSCKEGLGKAYIAGFQHVLKDPACAYVFEMDADFSHQPKYLPQFLEEISRADVVLGSRYMQGGGVENWGFVRRCISRFANAFIRVILGVPVHDLTGGFKCFRRQVLETLDFSHLESRGYNFQIELTYKALRQGFRIREIPIFFIERRAGVSKFNVGIMVESFWKVLLLRFQNQKKADDRKQNT
ncbi:MAG: polyprenol monophosphomannose synthase [Patescibacteria group bacterium]|nr:polyprenol monophosphomannose synthase [Patescibacteria group bacterium]MDD5715715.1 polyprenol monophosphomannose synthase [Patescibacteria group bacterium]